jgi:hypothetical protein
VSQQTFLRVVSRLKSKGYEPIPLDDRLTVSIVSNPDTAVISDKVRFTLNGTGHIAQYCEDDTMAGKPFIAIIKDRTITLDKNKASSIDINEYDVRVKGRREIELKNDDPRVLDALKNWSTKRKYFRLIKRWTFKTPSNSGLIFDLSMTRSTKRSDKGSTSQYKFQDQPLITRAPEYEIEVELDHSVFPEGSNPDKPFNTLIHGIGDILRGIQGCPVLTRKSTKSDTIQSYKELTKTDRFRGVAPVTLELKNMELESEHGVPNIRSGYNVTDKADGLRVHGFTNDDGELYMIDMAFNVYRTGYRNVSCKNALLDGEYITQNNEGKSIQELLFFDAYYINGKDVSNIPFKDQSDNCRYSMLESWLKTWKDGGLVKLLNSASLLIGMKTFYFTKPGDSKDSIFTKASNILNKKQNYYTDGLIFTPNALPLPSNPGVGFLHQFKWKPSKDNSIDFLVRIAKSTENK